MSLNRSTRTFRRIIQRAYLSNNQNSAYRLQSSASYARYAFNKPICCQHILFQSTQIIHCHAGSRKRYSTSTSSNTQSPNKIDKSTADYLFVKDASSEVLDTLSQDMIVTKDFISEAEEQCLLDEIDKYMRRLRYEFDHWDNAIHGYRETEKRSWNENNSQILQRVKDLAFDPMASPLAYVHVLDIAKEGYIKPHVDALRFCGDTIAGICLLSPCVMRLAQEKDSTQFGDVYLPRRSLYIMRGKARYDYTHEVLKDEESYFKGEHVPRDRRISVICRNEPALQGTE